MSLLQRTVVLCHVCQHEMRTPDTTVSEGNRRKRCEIYHENSVPGWVCNTLIASQGPYLLLRCLKLSLMLPPIVVLYLPSSHTQHSLPKVQWYFHWVWGPREEYGLKLEWAQFVSCQYHHANECRPVPVNSERMNKISRNSGKIHRMAHGKCAPGALVPKKKKNTAPVQIQKFELYFKM